jgi:anti-sigma factor RsiW
MSLPDEELLSAYLDGELSADERSRVERLLAESPESRQLLDELRSIQTSLQRMPRARLGHDFADQVLRQAERELLTAGGINDGGSMELGGEKPRVVSPSGRAETAGAAGPVSWQRLRRPVIWASLTLAAGLLIMFLDRGARLGRQVAMAPKEAQQREHEWGAHPKDVAPEGVVQDHDGIEFSAPAAPAFYDSLERSSGIPAEPESRNGHYSRSESMPAGATPLPAAMPPSGLDIPPPPAGMAGSRGAAAAGKPAEADSRNEASRSLEQLEMKGVDAAALADEKLYFRAADKTLVVWCDVAPGTNYSESFRELLAEQNIRWEGEAEVAEKESLLGLESEVKNVDEAPAGGTSQAETDLKLGEQRLNKRLADAEQAVLDSDDEVVLVEAGQPQIEAVLAAIDGATSVFVNVEVEPTADAPEQQRQLQRFARGKVLTESLRDLDEESTEQSKKREEAPLPRKAKQAAGEDDPIHAGAGVARRLAVRAAAPPDETAKDETKEEPPLAQSRSKRERDGEMKKSVEPFAFGLGRTDRQATDKDRFQVLFVLHPVDPSSSPAATKPLDAKSSGARPADAKPSSTDD